MCASCQLRHSSWSPRSITWYSRRTCPHLVWESTTLRCVLEGWSPSFMYCTISTNEYDLDLFVIVFVVFIGWGSNGEPFDHCPTSSHVEPSNCDVPGKHNCVECYRTLVRGSFVSTSPVVLLDFKRNLRRHTLLLAFCHEIINQNDSKYWISSPYA